jgi:hypothetical protein
MTVLDEQAQRLANVDAENFLGQLLWYSMSEVRVPHQDAVNLMNAEGIVGVPLAPKDADVFKRITSKVKRDKIPTHDPDVFYNYRMVEFRDDESITRRVVRERIDSAGKKLSVQERFDIDFNRATSQIEFKDIANGLVYNSADDVSIRDEVQSEYDMWRGCMNAYGLRQWMRGKILGLGATMVRPGGGIYFVHQTHVDQVEALERLGSKLEPYCVDTNGKVEFHSLPLVDDRKQRDMIQKAFEAETVDAIDEIMAEIAKIAKSDRKITSDRYAGLVTQYKELTAKTTDYEELLEQKLASTSARLELFERSLRNILPKVKPTK